MNAEVEAADQVLRLTMDGFVYFFKVPAAMLEAGIKIFGMIQKAIQENTVGAVKIKEIIKEGNGIASFSIPQSELDVFTRQAKAYNLRYTPIFPESGDLQKSIATIIVPGNQAGIANAIIQSNQLHGRMLNDSQYAGKEREAVVEKPVQKEEDHPDQEPAAEKEDMAAESSIPESEADRPLTQEEVARQNEAFLRGELGQQGPHDNKEKQKEVTEPDPTSAASQSESLYERKSTGSSTVGSPEVDIENLPSEIWPEKEDGRISVKAAAKEAQMFLEERQQKAAAPSPKKEPTMLDSIVDKIEAQNKELLERAGTVKGE